MFKVPAEMSDGFNKVPAENFLTTVAINVDNEGLSDADFREFIRNCLPVVRFPAPRQECQLRPGLAARDA